MSGERGGRCILTARWVSCACRPPSHSEITSRYLDAIVFPPYVLRQSDCRHVLPVCVGVHVPHVRTSVARFTTLN